MMPFYAKLNNGLFILLILLLCGCHQASLDRVRSAPLFDLPEQNMQVHLAQEEMIAKIGEVLSLKTLTTKDRGTFYFERGVLYDSLGLWTLARYDFAQALKFQPKMAEVYNYLGLYSLLEEDYSNALKAFNRVLKLNPHYDYAYLNRGLSFYYSHQLKLATRDFFKFYQADKTDPYRVLWLYLSELKLAPTVARSNLKERSKTLSNEYWGTNIVRYYLGELSLPQLQQKIEAIKDKASTEYAEVLTETYFYLAKQQLYLDNQQQAKELFKLALINQIYGFVEYRFALLELLKLNNVRTEQAVADSQ